MAFRCMIEVLKTRGVPDKSYSYVLNGRYLHTTSVCCEVRSGKVKPTPKRDKPVTYEMALRPWDIGHRKSWNSFNTSSLEGGLRTAETVFEDIFIRKFITGTFHDMVFSEVIIKRQHNIIRIAMLLFPRTSPSATCFLIGYTEEMLSHWLQCIVKLEIQTISSPKDTIFKYV